MRLVPYRKSFYMPFVVVSNLFDLLENVGKNERASLDLNADRRLWMSDTRSD